MEEFLHRLATYLTETLRRDDVEHWHYSDYITVAGCRFYMKRVRRGMSVDFCGLRFKLATYRVLDVALALLKELPKRVAERQAAEEESNRHDEARLVDRCVDGSAFSVYYYEGKYTLSFKHSCRLTVMASIDYLQDGGFTGESAPQVDAAKFRAIQIQRIWNQMSPEERSAFLASTKTED